MKYSKPYKQKKIVQSLTGLKIIFI